MQSLKAKAKDIIHRGNGSTRGKNILITGGSGFLAAHVLNAFLSNGYNVRATVRSQNSADKVKSTHSQYTDQLSFAIVEDITEPGVFDEAVKGVDGVSSHENPIYHKFGRIDKLVLDYPHGFTFCDGRYHR
jgi:NAD(P)-dependent dehydrogenase (short-subunit alcohol dehydrogenase family)